MKGGGRGKSGGKSHDFPSVLRGVAKCNSAAGAAQPLCPGTTMTRRASLRQQSVSKGGRAGGRGREEGREAGRGGGREVGREGGRQRGREAGRQEGRQAGSHLGSRAVSLLVT